MTLNPARANNYIIISPVKDEQRFLETTISAVVRQTVRPSRWIIVDDGSQDNTPAILERHSKRVPWITVLRVNRDGQRDLGTAEIRAFAAGYELVHNTPHDFIVKLDCDLDLPPDYFEQLIARFHQDETLGIASGTYFERRGNRWLSRDMPSYHASGASKMMRAECFSQIGGFILTRGWDTVDEIRAQVMGWKTTHFEDLKFYHLRTEGSAMGFVKTWLLLGEIYYLTGGGTLFFLLKLLHRAIVGKPFLLGAFCMLVGFLKAKIRGRPILLNESETKFYRNLLNQRILDGVAGVFRRPRLKRESASSK